MSNLGADSLSLIFDQDVLKNVAQCQNAPQLALFVYDDESVYARFSNRVKDRVKPIV